MHTFHNNNHVSWHKINTRLSITCRHDRIQHLAFVGFANDGLVLDVKRRKARRRIDDATANILFRWRHRRDHEAITTYGARRL